MGTIQNEFCYSCKHLDSCNSKYVRLYDCTEFDEIDNPTFGESKNLYEYLIQKCYELRNAKERYEKSKEAFLYCAHSLETSVFWMDSIDAKARDMQIAFYKYAEFKFLLHQIIWTLGNEDLKNTYNEIMEEDE